MSNGKMITSVKDSMVMGNTVATNDDLKVFNEAAKEAQNAFAQNIEKQLEASRKVREESESLEIHPTGGYVLMRIYEENPYQVVKQTNSGLILGTYTGNYKSQETGEMETEKKAVLYAEVMEVGPDCKFTKVGDEIVFRNCTQLPVPFLGQELWVTHENNVVVIINENLKERFNG